jgi:WD40 repeat protein
VAILKGHEGEVLSCEWNHLNKSKVISASMDKTVRLWDMT